MALAHRAPPWVELLLQESSQSKHARALAIRRNETQSSTD